MLQPYAHNAVVVMDADGDTAALGAAITVTLCGSLDHDPPCPVAAHHTATAVIDDRVTVRVLFVAEPDRENDVRTTIDAAMRRGTVRTVHGGADWTFVSSTPSSVRPDERDHADRLARSV